MSARRRQRGDTPGVEWQQGDTAATPGAPAAATARALGRVAVFGAVSAAGLVAAAVLGDGYFEIAKHTWLAAYLVEVTATSVVLGLAVVAARRTFVIEPRKRRSHRTAGGAEDS